MGALHEGHDSLVRKARRENDIVVASIFVNPLQFGPKEDFSRYPRDIKGDSKKLKSAGLDVLFTTTSADMYHDGFVTYVLADVALTNVLCGASRPGHFRGVLTVVAKLFNIVRPTNAYFGQKDFQQATLISRMAEDLNFPLKVKVCPTVREKNGLAMSSRNMYLNPDERDQAVVISSALFECKRVAESGRVHDAKKAIKWMREIISSAPLARIDYIEIVDRANLKKADKIEGKLAACAAVFFGKTRLIDNVLIDAPRRHASKKR
jgi:pantoate--beta-alanine ligase